MAMVQTGLPGRMLWECESIALEELRVWLEMLEVVRESETLDKEAMSLYVGIVQARDWEMGAAHARRRMREMFTQGWPESVVTWGDLAVHGLGCAYRNWREVRALALEALANFAGSSLDGWVQERGEQLVSSVDEVAADVGMVCEQHALALPEYVAEWLAARREGQNIPGRYLR